MTLDQNLGTIQQGLLSGGGGGGGKGLLFKSSLRCCQDFVCEWFCFGSKAVNASGSHERIGDTRGP